MSVASTSPLDQLLQQVARQSPFSDLDPEQRADWFAGASLLKLVAGERLLRPDQLPQQVLLLVKGEVRLLVEDPTDRRPITLEKQGKGQLLGWSSLLRGAACEWVSASSEVVVLAPHPPASRKAPSRAIRTASAGPRLARL